MKYQYKISKSPPEGDFSDKDRAIRAGRKAASAFVGNTDILNIEILGDGNVIHRDIILSDEYKDMDMENLSEQCITDLTKKPEEVVIRKEVNDQPLLVEGDYCIADDELHLITQVTPGRALAQPVRKKHVELVDKLTDKKSKFTIRRRSVSLSPYGIKLSKEEVEKELLKIKELEDNGNIERSNECVKPGSGDAPQEPAESQGHSEDGNGDPTDNSKRTRKVRRKK